MERKVNYRQELKYQTQTGISDDLTILDTIITKASHAAKTTTETRENWRNWTSVDDESNEEKSLIGDTWRKKGKTKARGKRANYKKSKIRKLNSKKCNWPAWNGDLSDRDQTGSRWIIIETFVDKLQIRTNFYLTDAGKIDAEEKREWDKFWNT